jgi:hypothetical protein
MDESIYTEAYEIPSQGGREKWLSDQPEEVLKDHKLRMCLETLTFLYAQEKESRPAGRTGWREELY